jgi:MbtH protein
MSDSVTYQAVRNDQEQFSIWPAHRAIPGGWHKVGPIGSKDEVLKYVETVWTDIRPACVREAIRGRTQMKNVNP